MLPLLAGVRSPFVHLTGQAHYSMTVRQEKPFSVGKYLLSPFTRLTDAGHYVASISIRSGNGTASHDRVFRFTPRFRSEQSALAYASREGRHLALQH